MIRIILVLLSFVVLTIELSTPGCLIHSGGRPTFHSLLLGKFPRALFTSAYGTTLQSGSPSSGGQAAKKNSNSKKSVPPTKIVNAQQKVSGQASTKCSVANKISPDTDKSNTKGLKKVSQTGSSPEDPATSEQGGLSETVTVDETFRAVVRDCKKTNAPKKLIRAVLDYESKGRLDQNMTVYALRTLQRMNRSDISLEMVPIWHRVVERQHLAYTGVTAQVPLPLQMQVPDIVSYSGASNSSAISSVPMPESIELLPAAILMRSCSKLQRQDLAEGIANKVGVNIDDLDAMIRNAAKASSASVADITVAGDSIITDSINSNNGDSNSEGGNLFGLSDFVYAACKKLLPELILGYMIKGAFPRAFSTMRIMYSLKIPMELDFSKQIMKIILRDTTADEARRGLKQLLSLGGLTDNDSLQLLTSVYMKSIDFVKGAVSMDTCPPAVCSEAAFIGRSNVGKSSLINMISNRKSLAFTSKTPGKTSEFNYFDAMGRVGLKNEKHRFYLVDLPGVGYAEVSRELKDSWLVLLKQYVTQRESLRVVFHLVDSRHGVLDADEECLSLLPSLPDYVQYAIVLTKVDKRSGGVRRDILERLQKEIRSRTDRRIPILFTSSETREGGAELWSVLLDSLAGDASSFYSRDGALSLASTSTTTSSSTASAGSSGTSDSHSNSSD